MKLCHVAVLLALGVASCSVASAQETGSPSPDAPEALVPAAADSLWSGGLDTYLYLQQEGVVVMPIARVDRGSLHLEGRFQYEDLLTGSAWLGWTFEMGDELHFALTPMVGGVFGRTNGVAPGLEMTLAWRSFELSSESEYLFDLEDAQNSFFYNWSELSWQALSWLSCGLALQRMRVYQTGLALETGAFVALRKGPVELSVYGFNLYGDGRYAIFGLGLNF
jgi:hypothetical protein